MKRRLLIGIGAVAVVALAFSAGAVIQPQWVSRLWIHLTSRSQWARQNRLGALVKLGMSPDEVEAILGRPMSQKDLAGGFRWRYWDRKLCAGSSLIVEFATFPSPRVAFVHQECPAHQLAPNPRYYTVGKTLEP